MLSNYKRRQQLRRFQKRMDAIPKAAREAVLPALDKNADEMVNMARHLAPKKTHALEESIVKTGPGEQTPPYSQPGGSRTAGEMEVLVTAGNSDVRYPHLVEYGSRKAAAQPYFWPAYRSLKKRMTGRTKRAISKAVREQWTK